MLLKIFVCTSLRIKIGSFGNRSKSDHSLVRLVYRNKNRFLYENKKVSQENCRTMITTFKNPFHILKNICMHHKWIYVHWYNTFICWAVREKECHESFRFSIKKKKNRRGKLSTALFLSLFHFISLNIYTDDKNFIHLIHLLFLLILFSFLFLFSFAFYNINDDQ